MCIEKHALETRFGNTLWTPLDALYALDALEVKHPRKTEKMCTQGLDGLERGWNGVGTGSCLKQSRPLIMRGENTTGAAVAVAVAVASLRSRGSSCNACPALATTPVPAHHCGTQRNQFEHRLQYFTMCDGRIQLGSETTLKNRERGAKGGI